MVDVGRSTCAVYAFREGAFSALGHDLKLQVTELTVEIGEDLSVRASCQTDSVRVVGVLRQGDTAAVDERLPSANDRQRIEHNVAHEILEAEKYPQATFRSTKVEPMGDRYRVVGLLDIQGTVREVAFTAERQGDRAVARLTLNQPDFRIKPFRAMMGALRVKPEVLLEVSVPFPRDKAEGEAAS
ncbi:MAG TPA: YceI family protein [Thermoanaerobaculia bacterium]|nr:YceI family protein [Thermoanaerobaculia bacterium]